MKKTFLTTILILIGIQTILGQTREQQRRADAYYQNQQTRQQNSSSWDWLFGSSNSNSSSGITADKWDDGSWYAGQYANAKQNGLGISYFKKHKSYIFSNWINDKQNGLTLQVNEDYNFFGKYKYGKKNGFGMSEWSKYNPLSAKGYDNIIKYVGNYKNAEWDGYGILYFKDGTYKSGIWIDSVLSKELSKLEVLEALGF